MTPMCFVGQCAAFNVNKMHISKNYIIFPIKNTQTTYYSKKITSQKKYNNNKKTHFFAEIHPYFAQPNGKVTLVCGHMANKI